MEGNASAIMCYVVNIAAIFQIHFGTLTHRNIAKLTNEYNICI